MRCFGDTLELHTRWTCLLSGVGNGDAASRYASAANAEDGGYYPNLYLFHCPEYAVILQRYKHSDKCQRKKLRNPQKQNLFPLFLSLFEDTITFGKYKGKTYKELFAEDPQYIKWFIRNNDRLDLDADSFNEMVMGI